MKNHCNAGILISMVSTAYDEDLQTHLTKTAHNLFLYCRLLQRCLHAWDMKDIDYESLIAGAEGSEAFRSIIDPDHSSFMNPENMPDAIRNYCRETGQPVPETGRTWWHRSPWMFRLRSGRWQG